MLDKTRPRNLAETLTKRLRAKAVEEFGQTLAITAVILVPVIFGMAVLAVDTGVWFQSHRQAQTAADAAALAGANCVSTGACTPSTAPGVAQSMCQSNGITNPTPDCSVTMGASTITVKTTTHPPSYFASLFNVTSTPNATAVATWQVRGSNCANPTGTTCGFIFANDPSCSGSGATVTNNGTSAIEGGIESNGDMTFSQSGNHQWNVTVSYAASSASHTGCTFNPNGGNHDPYSGTPSTYPLPTNTSNDWPINFSFDYPTCSPTGAYQCTGPGGTPSYCTFSSTLASWSPSAAPGVYCAVGSGSGVSASDPSTWNGSIIAGAVSGATYLGGSVTLSTSNGNFSPATGANPAPNLLAYATTGSVTVNGSGNGVGSGDVFAPNGTATVTFTGNESYTGFIEATDASYNSSGTDTGDGPQVSGGVIPTPPSDALIQ
jgi:hypothetical protein